MKLKDLAKHWNAFGEQDPFWAILTSPGKQNGGWDVEEFFARGRDEVDACLAAIDRHAPGLTRGRALDFGCGVGRLTQGIARHFSEAHGVDIAPSMIRLANEHNAFGDRVQYHVNERGDLTLFEDDAFDLVLSLIVLQHMRPGYALGYIREFVRVLRPGGVAYFQLPAKQIASAPPPAVVRVEPLPSTAFRADFDVTLPEPPYPAGLRVLATVRVRNASPDVWPAQALARTASPIRIAGRWFDAGAMEVPGEQPRVTLRVDLAPGEETEVVVPVNVPRAPGRYFLEFDAEQGIWFAAMGNMRAVGEVEVGPAVSQVEEVVQPRMEVYGTPLEDVTATIDAAGGRVIAIEPDHSAGANFESWRYLVTKDPA